MPYFRTVALVSNGTLIMPDSRNAQQFLPIAFQIAFGPDEMVIANITLDLRHDKAIACHHKAIDLRSYPFLSEDIGHNAAHLWGHGGKA